MSPNTISTEPVINSKHTTTAAPTIPTGQGGPPQMNISTIYTNHPEMPEAKAYADILALVHEVQAGAKPDLLRLALANSAYRRDAMIEVMSDHPELRSKQLRPFWRACLNYTTTAPQPTAPQAPYRFHYAKAPMAIEAIDEGYSKQVLETWDENEDGTHEFCLQEVWSGDRHTRHNTVIAIDGKEAPELAIGNPYAGSLHFTPKHGANPDAHAMMPRPHRNYNQDEWNPMFMSYLDKAPGTVERRLQILAWHAMHGHRITITAPAETNHARYIAQAIANVAVNGTPDYIGDIPKTRSATPTMRGWNDAAEYNDDLPPLYIEWDWSCFKVNRAGEVMYEVEPDTYIRRGNDHLLICKHGFKPLFVGKHIKAGEKVAADGTVFQATRYVKYSRTFKPNYWDMKEYIELLKDARTEYMLHHPIGQSWPINRMNRKGKIVPDNSARNWAYEHGYRKFDQEQVAEVWKYTQYDHFEKRQVMPISVQNLATRWLYDGRRNPEPDGRAREHDMERADDFNIGDNEEWNDATVIAQGAGYLTDEDISGMAAAELALIEDTYGAISEGEDEQGNPTYSGYTKQREAWYKDAEAAIAAMYKRSQPKGEEKCPSLTPQQAEILAWNKGLADHTISPQEIVQLAMSKGYRDSIKWKPVGDGTWNVYAYGAAAQMLKWTPIKIVSKDYALTIEQQKKYNNGRSYRPTPKPETPPLPPIGTPKLKHVNTDIKGWANLNKYIGYQPAKLAPKPKPTYLPIGATWGNMDSQANEQAAARKHASITAPTDTITDAAIRRRVKAAIKRNTK